MSREERNENKTKQISDAIKGRRQKQIKSDCRIQPGNTYLTVKGPPAYFKLCAIEASLASAPKEQPGASEYLSGHRAEHDWWLALTAPNTGLPDRHPGFGT